MVRMNRIAAVGLLLGFVGAMPALADRLHGTDYVGTAFGVYKYGDAYVDDIFGPNVHILGVFNKALGERVELLAQAGGAFGSGSTEGVDLTRNSFDGGLRLGLLLAPGKPVDPYVFGGGLVDYTQIDGDDGTDEASESDTSVGFELGAGIEFDLAPKLLLDVSAIYQQVDDFDGVAVRGKAGFAVTERLTVLLGGGYVVDEEDLFADIGFAVKL